MVPWWIDLDLDSKAARRMLKALTSALAAMAQRLGMEPGELRPLLETVLELQETGNDRRDLEEGITAVLLALEAEL